MEDFSKLSDEELRRQIADEEKNVQQQQQKQLQQLDPSKMTDEQLKQAIRQESLNKYAPQIQAAKKKASEEGPEGTAHKIARSVVGVGYDQFATWVYGRSLAALDRGDPDEADFRNIAVYEKQQEEESNRGGLESFAHGALKAPGHLVGFAAGGGVGGAAGAAAGLGGKAMLGARLLGAAAIAPQMTAQNAMEANIRAGRDPLDPKALPGALARSSVEMGFNEAGGQIAGRFLPKGWTDMAVKRMAAQGLANPVAQQVADIANHGLGLEEGWGLLGDIVNGKRGRAAKRAMTEFFMGAVLAGSHEFMRSGVSKREVIKSLEDGWDAEAARGKQTGTAKVPGAADQPAPRPAADGTTADAIQRPAADAVPDAQAVADVKPQVQPLLQRTQEGEVRPVDVMPSVESRVDRPADVPGESMMDKIRRRQAAQQGAQAKAQPAKKVREPVAEPAGKSAVDIQNEVARKYLPELQKGWERIESEFDEAIKGKPLKEQYKLRSEYDKKKTELLKSINSKGMAEVQDAIASRTEVPPPTQETTDGGLERGRTPRVIERVKLSQQETLERINSRLRKLDKNPGDDHVAEYRSLIEREGSLYPAELERLTQLAEYAYGVRMKEGSTRFEAMFDPEGRSHEKIRQERIAAGLGPNTDSLPPDMDRAQLHRSQSEYQAAQDAIRAKSAELRGDTSADPLTKYGEILRDFVPDSKSNPINVYELQDELRAARVSEGVIQRLVGGAYQTERQVARLKEEAKNYASPVDFGRKNSLGKPPLQDSGDPASGIGGSRIANKALEWLTKNRQAAPAPPVSLSSERLPPLQDRDIHKAIATETRGAAKLGGIGSVVDPRGRDHGGGNAEVIAYESAKQIGVGHAARVLEEFRGKYKNLFTFDKDGRILLQNGLFAPQSDVFQAEMKRPGSQPLSTRQREMVQEWKSLKDELKRNATLSGRDWTDREGRPLPDDYFPRTSIETPSGKTGVGFGSMKRMHPTEESGIQAGTKYVKDPFERIGEAIKQSYALDAMHRLATDPALGGLTPSQWFKKALTVHKPEIDQMPPQEKKDFIKNLWGKAQRLPTSPGQPGHYRDVFSQKIYPDDVAKTLIDRVARKPYAWVERLEKFADLRKIGKLTLDVAVGQIQGLQLAFRHPAIWAKSQAALFKKLVGKHVLAQEMQDPENRAAVSFYVQGNGTFGVLPDFLEGTGREAWIHHVPLVGKVYHHLGKTVETYFDVAKLYWAKNQMRKGIDPKEWAREVENFENMLGAGRSRSIGVGAGQRSVEKLGVIAPSYYRSAINQLGEIVGGTSKSRKETLKTLGAFAAGSTAMFVGTSLAAGMAWDEIRKRLNPADQNFMMTDVPLPDRKVQKVGIGGFHRSVLKLITDVLTGDNAGESIRKFLASKEGFVVRDVVELSSGKDYRGDPMTWQQWLLGAVVPANVEKIITNSNASPWQRAAEAAFDTAGLKTWPQSERERHMSSLDSKARANFGSKYDELGLKDQRAVVKEVGPPAKTPSSPQRTALGIQYAQERSQSIMKAMPKESQAALKELGRTIPQIPRTFNVSGIEVPLTDKQSLVYQNIAVEEYQKAVSKLDMNRLRAMKPERRKDVVDASMEAATGRVHARFMKELLNTPASKSVYNKKLPGVRIGFSEAE